MGSSSSSVAGSKRQRQTQQDNSTSAKVTTGDSPQSPQIQSSKMDELRRQLQVKQDEIKILSQAVESKDAENKDLKRKMDGLSVPKEIQITQNNTDAALAKLQADISEFEEALESKNLEIAHLQMQLHNLKLQKDKQIEVLKETIEKVINEKDFKLRRLEALWGETDQRQGIIPNYSENAHGAARFGISAENSRQDVAKKHGQSPKSNSEITNIRRAFRKNIFLSNLGKTQVEELTLYMEKVKMKAGEVIIREGDNGSDLYVIEEGKVNVVKEQGDQLLATLSPGCVFGELAVLYNCKRTASVRAKTDVLLWSLSRFNFQNIVQRSGEKIRQEYIGLLEQVPQFSELSQEKITRICDCLVKEAFEAGKYIIRQGEVGDTFYIVSDGKVKVTKNVERGETGEEFLTYVERGSFFGERALLSDERRAANVIAHTDVICLTMDRQAFNSLIGHISMETSGDTDAELGVEGKSTESVSESRYDEEQQKQSEDGGVPKTDRDIILDTPLPDIQVLKLIGKGGFGSVSLVSIKGLGDRPLALKKIRKAFIAKMGQERHVVEERKLLLSVFSPFICRLYRTYKDDHFVYMLMDAYLGGDLFMYMKHRGSFPDDSARFVVGCVAEALGYLHSRVIAYRDLKPENLMIDQKGYVKLIDFGFAKKMMKGNKTWTFCGTPEYFPPEILQNSGHDYSADYWSLGILTFELLTGTTPFFAPDEMTVYESIIDGIERVKFPDCVTKNAELFVRNLCKLDPQNRLGNTSGGFNEIRKHRWYRGFHWEGLRRQKLVSPVDSTVANPTKTNFFDTTTSEKQDFGTDETLDCSDWDFNF